MLLKIISQLSIIFFTAPLTLTAPVPDNTILVSSAQSSVVSETGGGLVGSEYELGRKDAQSYVAPRSIKTASLVYGQFSATTPKEIAVKKAEEAAKKALDERTRRFAFASVAASYSNLGCDSYCWPLTSFRFTPRNNGFRTAIRPNHDGFDMLTSQGDSIYSVYDGVVRISQESYGGYGVAVVVDYVIGGKPVSMTYGHMSYGTRAVKVGERVAAGQVLGLVGSTGRSTANHLHIEIRVNGVLVDPYPWLIEHAGLPPQ